MLTNDTVNLLTLVLRSALPARVVANTLTDIKLFVLQLQSCCRLRDYGFRIIEGFVIYPSHTALGTSELAYRRLHPEVNLRSSHSRFCAKSIFPSQDYR